MQQIQNILKDNPENNLQHNFSLLEAISSLKEINRSIYALNTREGEIKFSYKADYQEELLKLMKT